MKKIIISFLILFISFSDCYASFDISAKSAILTEQSSNISLYEKNADRIMKPASTTKILTAICALENKNINDRIKVSEKAVRTEGSSMYLKPGEVITLKNLLYGLLLNSGNDAANAIAEYVDKDFIGLMNKTAKKIGATNSNFKNPSGLDEKMHYVTARDLAKITSYGLNIPEFSKIIGTKSKIVKTEDGTNKYLTNHNKMLKMYKYAIGGKTGFTKSSGRTLVSVAEKNNIKLIAVTLNAPDDWNDHIKLLNYGFDIVRKKTFYQKDDILTNAPVINGEKHFVKLKCKNDYSYCYNKNEKNDFDIKFNVKTLRAPVNKNDIAGEIIILKNGKIIHRENLITYEKVNVDFSFKIFFKILKRYLNYD